MDPQERPKQVLSPLDQERLVNLLEVVPHGVVAMSQTVPGLVETSTNLAVVRTEEAGVRILTSQRSALEAELTNICRQVVAAGKKAGAQVDEGPGYPAWTPNPESHLLGTAQAVFRRVFREDPQVKAVHAGLECGIIGAKFDGMDMVSFGPTIRGAHSPSERVNIPSVEGFWTFLTALLDHLSG
jgi:dipeptidase D